MGLRPVLLTGDNDRAARAVADQVGIDEVIFWGNIAAQVGGPHVQSPRSCPARAG